MRFIRIDYVGAPSEKETRKNRKVIYRKESFFFNSCGVVFEKILSALIVDVHTHTKKACFIASNSILMKELISQHNDEYKSSELELCEYRMMLNKIE